MPTIESKPFVPEAQRSTLVKQMMGTCKCDEKTAKHYLSDEGWKLPAAISSYKEDKAKGIHAKEIPMIKTNAAVRLKAANEEPQKTVKAWAGTNGRYAELKLVAELLLVMKKSLAEGVMVTPGAASEAKRIIDNAKCSFAEFEAAVKECLSEYKLNSKSAYDGANDSFKSAKMDYKDSK